MEEYDYSFIYTPGKDNIIADMISRYPYHPAAPSELLDVCTTTEALSINDEDNDECPIAFHVIAHHQQNDKQLQNLLHQPDYSIKNVHGSDIIFIKIKLLFHPAFSTVSLHGIMNF